MFTFVKWIALKLLNKDSIHCPTEISDSKLKQTSPIEIFFEFRKNAYSAIKCPIEIKPKVSKYYNQHGLHGQPVQDLWHGQGVHPLP